MEVSGDSKQLYEWLQLIREVIRSQVRTVDWHDDISQNVCMKLIKHLQKGGVITKGLIVTATKNTCIDFLRTHRYDRLSISEGVMNLVTVSVPFNSPVMMELFTWVDTLPETQRHILKHVLQFKRYDTIRTLADTYGVSERTAKTALANLKKRLKQKG